MFFFFLIKLFYFDPNFIEFCSLGCPINYKPALAQKLDNGLAPNVYGDKLDVHDQSFSYGSCPGNEQNISVCDKYDPSKNEEKNRIRGEENP